MKKILVIYYTQTGQLENIINAIFSDIIKDDNVKTDFVRIYPKKEYPFPWQPSETFYDVFPESVKEITTPLKEINIKNPEQYDLIVVGLQVWYLSPSIPANSFLNTDIVRKTIKNKPVITIYGTRNMWVSANKTIKKLITEAGGKTAGNIVLYDKHNNYISVMTIIRWLIKGQKQKSKYLPEAGVSDKDIKEAVKFGQPVLNALKNNKFDNLQNELIKLGAVNIDYRLMKTELTGKKIFNIWASLILNNSTPGSKKRKRLLKLFSYYLLFVIYIISPVASLIFRLKKLFFPKKTKKEIIQHTRL